MDCVITPYAAVDVSSAVPGVIAAVDVDRGDTVKQGQALARLDDGVEQTSVDLAEARARMETDIHLEQVNLNFDDRKRDRLQALYSHQALSVQDKDRAERDAALSTWKLKQAKDLYHVRQLELRRAEAVLRQKTVLSPINGVVVQRYKSPGEYVENQPILRLVRLDPLYVEAIAPMQLFDQVKVGMAAVVLPESLSTGPHQAIVKAVDPMGDAASGTFGMRLEMPNPGNRLPAGMKCSVRVQPGVTPKVQLAPSQSPAPSQPFPPPAPRGAQARPGAGEQHGATDQALRGASEPIRPAGTGGPAHPTAAACYSVGPLQDAAQMGRVVPLLEARGLRVHRRDQVPDTPAAFVVLTPHQDSEAQRRRIVARLRDKGVRDFALIRRGTFENRLSLGVYNRRRWAENRRQQLAALGFTTEVVAEAARRGSTWLDIVPPPDFSPDALRAIVNRVGSALTISAATCPNVIASRE